jgi:hypothetical protein
MAEQKPIPESGSNRKIPSLNVLDIFARKRVALTALFYRWHIMGKGGD